MVWIGPSRAKRSLNDECIVVHPLHDDLCDQLEVRRSNGIRRNRLAVNMQAAQDQDTPDLLNGRHNPQPANRCLNDTRDDRMLDQLVQERKADLVPLPDRHTTLPLADQFVQRSRRCAGAILAGNGYDLLNSPS